MEWKDLEVWKQAHGLALKVYHVAGEFPAEERYRLADQLCRCAISVAANIVEGHARHTTREYLQFLYTARGSAEEARYHLLLARELGYLKDGKYQELDSQYSQLSRMLNALISSLRRKNA